MRFIFTAIATDVIQDMVEGKGNIKWRENEMKKERKRKKSSKKNPIAVRCLFTPFRARVPCHNLFMSQFAQATQDMVMLSLLWWLVCPSISNGHPSVHLWAGKFH